MASSGVNLIQIKDIIYLCKLCKGKKSIVMPRYYKHYAFQHYYELQKFSETECSRDTARNRFH